MGTSLECPHCGRVGTTPRPLDPGSKVRCKGCGQPFEVPVDPGIPDDLSIELDDDPAQVASDPVAPPSQAPTATTFVPASAPDPPLGFTPVPPPAPTRTIPATTGGGGVKGTILWLLAIVFTLSGLVALASGGPSSSYDYRDRFQSDNAYGATANALEKIAGEIRSMRGSGPAAWFIAALACVLINSVDRVRIAVERR